MSDELKINDSAAHAPKEVRKWAERFMKVHDCPVTLSKEASGYHLYIPCPACLETHGKRELQDPKYSINLSMLAGLGDYRDDTGCGFTLGDVQRRMDLEKTKDAKSSICMRTRSSRDPHRYNIDELINMATVTERHPDIHTAAVMRGSADSSELEAHWEKDTVGGTDTMCPPPAGDMVTLTSLPDEHPAVVYLRDRGYDMTKLQEQFACRFCTKEYPYGQNGIYYRKLVAGWKDTPQHRVIFHSLIDGAPMTWQARLLEKVENEGRDRYMLHPYVGGFYPSSDEEAVRRSVEKDKPTNQDQVVLCFDAGRNGYWAHCWCLTHTRSNPEASWVPVAPYDEEREGVLRFQPAKYKTAKHSTRQMMGWDAACNRAQGDTIRWAVLCEGPLDAARVGPGGVALIGSSISPDNAARVISNFHVVFSGFDMDKAGKQATEKITRMLQTTKSRAPLLIDVIPLPIPAGKDLGDLSQEDFDSMLKRMIRRMKRIT